MCNDILKFINSPCDLKSLSQKEKVILCREIREFLIDKVSKSGGHLASNLGVVELSVALHSVFNSPEDKIIFDVGHQSYVHKIITGRKDSFDSLRKAGGLSGFTMMRESEHDAFGAGHSSTAISAALGFAEANKMSGSENYSVAVVGDGAFTGGLVHEALNNVKKDLKFIIVLNENRMSISKNKGAFAAYLAKVRVSKSYIGVKKGANSVLKKIPLIGKPILSFLTFIKNQIKRIVYSNNYFEELGLYYIGPVDGNDYATVERALKEAKRIGKSVIIHAYTKKGKGYEPAEISPPAFHNISKHCTDLPLFHKIFAEELVSFAGNDEKIAAVTAAMGIGTGLEFFGEKYPERYFDVGIAEGHALTFSAALCAAGMKPYVAIYSTFLQRGYDNILHDIALQKLPVRIIIDRAGLAEADGPTHHGIFDVSFLSHIPGIKILAPVTYGSLKEAVRESVTSEYPLAIRYSNTSQSDRVDRTFYPDKDYSNHLARFDFSDDNVPEFVFITYGNIAQKVLRAKDKLNEKGYSVGIVLAEVLKPYDDLIEMLASKLNGVRGVLFVEEGILNGGFSMILLNKMKNEYPCFENTKFSVSAIDDDFVSPCERVDIFEFCGLSEDKLAEKMETLINQKNEAHI